MKKFIQSFKEIDRKLACVILADIAFYAAITLGAIISLKIAAAGISAFSQIPVEMLDINKLSEMSQFDAGLDETIKLMGAFKSKISISIAVFLTIFFAAFTIFKGIAWAIVTRQKLSRKYFLQFFKLMLLMLGGTVILLALLFWATLPAATGFLMLLTISIASYIIPITCAVFKPSKTIKELLKQMWHVGIERFYYFILPIIASGAILLTLILITAAIGMLMNRPTAVSLMMLTAIIIWQSWMKYYIYTIARGIK
ncbi:MAG: hypothetical protein QW666_01725 [Candidatus Woesearchaeota archaeon]